MKKIYLILLVVFTSACGDNFLDLQPESVADIEDIYKTENDFFQALIGSYDELQSSGQYGRNFQFLFETRGDIVGESSAGFQDGIYYEVDRFLLRSENPLLQQSWSSLYSGIYRTNIILERLNEVDLGSSFKNQIRSEARFIRALSYFNIVRIWGPAPLIRGTLSPDQALEVGRDDPSIIFNFLIDELEDISDLLPDTYSDEDAGRVTRYAALTLLAKVLLEQDDYLGAETILDQIISSSLFDLQEDFQDVFSLQNEANNEIIFAVKWKRLLEETNLFFGRATNPITIEQEFIDTFESGDERLNASRLIAVGSYTTPAKFNDPAGLDGRTGLDYPVFRFADVLLMYAEAVNAQGFQANSDAFAALNRVRERAGLNEVNNTLVSNQETFRETLLNERRRELVFEGHTWFDLIRLGNPVETFLRQGISIDQGQFVYPIPQSEIDRINSNRFQQNPAYQ